MNMGCYSTVINDMANSLALCVKANDWLQINDINDFDIKTFKDNELTVDTTQLLNGSLFTPM